MNYIPHLENQHFCVYVPCKYTSTLVARMAILFNVKDHIKEDIHSSKPCEYCAGNIFSYAILRY